VLTPKSPPRGFRKPSAAFLLTRDVSASEDDEQSPPLPTAPQQHVIPKQAIPKTPVLSNLLPPLEDILEELKLVAESHQDCRLFAKRGLENHTVLRQELFLFKSVLTSKLSACSIPSRIRRAIRGYWFQSELRITLQSVKYMSEAARVANGIYELLRVEVASLHGSQQKDMFPASISSELSKSIRAYTYNLIVLMTITAFPGNMCASLIFQYDEEHRSRDAMVLAKMLRQPMPRDFKSARCRLLDKSAKCLHSSGDIADGFPVHRSWVENGSSCAFVGLYYAWCIGLGELNDQDLYEHKHKAMHTMLDVESILRTCIQHVLSDAIAELNEQLACVSFLNTAVVTLVCVVPISLWGLFAVPDAF